MHTTRTFLLALSLGLLGGCGAHPGDTERPISMPDFTQMRERMVATQIAAPGRGVTNKSVLRAMREVPRHEFVPEAQRHLAYEDHPLPIGEGQTISQPYIVALMTERLEPRPEDRVLEIGTGSGYQAAVLARLVRDVYTLEIVESLGLRARDDLVRLGFTNVHVRIADGYQGWPEQAPFDAIIVTCSPDHVPAPLTAQLKEGGRMIIPVGRGVQELILLEKQGAKLVRRSVLPVRFVPMTGEAEQDNHR